MNLAIVVIIPLVLLLLFFVVLIVIGLKGDKKKEADKPSETVSTPEPSETQKPKIGFWGTWKESLVLIIALLAILWYLF